MNSSRNINASLFVTVLSACLGLLIVGVPVQAQSQSATDNVGCSDKAPAEVESLLDQKDFINPIAEFISDLGKLISTDKYDLKERDLIEIIVEVPQDGTIGFKVSSSNEWIRVAAESAAEQICYDFGGNDKFYHNDSNWKNPVERFVITFLLENSSLTIKATLEQPTLEQARKLAATYNSYFSLGACRERGEPDEVLYQNTKALTDNNQVLIVTHLPRAGLSELLAKKPAAN